MALPARQLVARGVGDKIRAYRTARGWSQERLARECNPPLTRQTIYTAEAGANVPEWENIERIAEALQVDFWELLPERPFFVASGGNEAGDGAPSTGSSQTRRFVRFGHTSQLDPRVRVA